MKVWLMAALAATMTLAGCADDSGPEVLEDIPDEITQTDLEELEQLVSAQFPRRFSFPGQELLDPVQVLFDDYLAPGDGFLAPELPDDDGPVDAGTMYLPFDLSEHVAVGQAVELRIKLKWWGDPGSSADLDIFVNVPGERDAYTPDRFDESWNWNIVTKFRVVNTVRTADDPFEVGLQVANGKNIHPDGIHYRLSVDIVYGQDVLPPNVPYVITVPEGATNLILESEPLTGDEHVTSELMIIDPDDQLHRYIKHNDIATETILVSVPVPGDYIIYSHHQHGGFLRIEADVPNEDFMARPLERVKERTVLYSSPAPPVPGTYTEQCVRVIDLLDCDALPTANSQGATGTFDITGPFPLDIATYIDTGAGGAVDAALNITSAAGWVSTSAANLNIQNGDDRIGGHKLDLHDRSRIDSGAYQYFLVVNGGAIEVGYEVTTYQR